MLTRDLAPILFDSVPRSLDFRSDFVNDLGRGPRWRPGILQKLLGGYDLLPDSSIAVSPCLVDHIIKIGPAHLGEPPGYRDPRLGELGLELFASEEFRISRQARLLALRRIA